MQDATTSEEKKDLLSIGQSAEYLGISIDTLRRWEKKDRIKTYRSPGNHRYFYRKDLDKLFGSKYERIAPTKKYKKIKSPETPKEDKNDKEEKKDFDNIEEKGDQITGPALEEVVDWSYKYEDKKERIVEIPKNEPVRIKSVVQKEQVSYTNEELFGQIIHHNQYAQVHTQESPAPPLPTSIQSPPEYIVQDTSTSKHTEDDQKNQKTPGILETPPQDKKKPQDTEKSQSFFLSTNQVIILTIITFTIAAAMLMLVFVNPQPEILSPIP